MRLLNWLRLGLLGMMAMPNPGSAQTVHWEQITPIPDPIGFAGSVAGISRGALLVGGGANFPDNVGPWGPMPKTWYDVVYALPNAKGAWKPVGKLPHKMGYSVALTIPDGVLCVGGADGERHYAEVFVLQYVNGRLATKYLSPLPFPLANASGAVLDGVVYVAGGTTSPTASTAESVFLSLDLSKPGAGWQQRPAWPGPGRMLAVTGAQDGKFYLFSGTELYQEPGSEAVKRRYLTDAYAYDPKQNAWQRLADLPRPAVAAPSPAFSVGKDRLLITGGDNGSNAERNLILKEKHPGFRTDRLTFNTRTNAWTTTEQGARIPNLDQQTGKAIRWMPVTTPSVVWNGAYVLPGGEVRPGMRTNRVLVHKPTKP